ncbi:MAG: hypothetical protein AAF489_09205 [Bacteroidota bacterium]
MKPRKEIVPNLIMTFLGCLVLFCCFMYLKEIKLTEGEESKVFAKLSGIVRVIIALSAAAVSISLPGFVELETQRESGDT